MGFAWNRIFTRLGWDHTDTKLAPLVDYNANAQLGIEGVGQGDHAEF